MEFITKLNYSSEIVTMVEECRDIINKIGLEPGGQISLKSKNSAVDPWRSGVGSLYDFNQNVITDNEQNFTVWNLGEESYVRRQIEAVEKNFNFSTGRVRIMRLKPKHGLSVHHDMEARVHFVLQTNPYSYFSLNHSNLPDGLNPVGEFYHIPADSHWYMVDTTKTHWVYNGGKTDRIHIVACIR